MDNYTERLKEQFKSLKIELVEFNNGATPQSMAAYVLVSGLTKEMLKDKGNMVLDLGNYLYRVYGLSYEMCPEFHRNGEPKNSVAWYISKQCFDKQQRLKEWVISVYNESNPDKTTKRYESALYNQQRFLVQGETK